MNDAEAKAAFDGHKPVRVTNPNEARGQYPGNPSPNTPNNTNTPSNPSRNNQNNPANRDNQGNPRGPNVANATNGSNGQNGPGYIVRLDGSNATVQWADNTQTTRPVGDLIAA